MDGNEILLLGLGIQAPWQLVDQRLDVDKQPHELHLAVRSDRGQKCACPVCGAQCGPHDFQEKTWRHLNLFQHHDCIHASVPRVKCAEHGVKLVDVPWARKGSAFTLLFKQAALTLVREMPVNAAARIIEVTDKRLWRIVGYYVAKAVAAFDLSSVKAIGLDETASKRGRRYVTVFIDMERREKPLLFVTPGHAWQGDAQGIPELPARAQGPSRAHPGSELRHVEGLSWCGTEGTAQWTDHRGLVPHRADLHPALDEVRKAENRIKPLPKHLRWAMLKRGEADRLTTNQLKAMAELLAQGLDTATAWRIKERLRWVRLARAPQPGRRRITQFINYATGLIGESRLFRPMCQALQTLRMPAEREVRRWTSTYTNARLAGAQRAVPGGACQSPRITQRGDLHDHDLHDPWPGRGAVLKST